MQTPVDKSLTTAIFVSLTIIASGSAQSKPTVITFDPVGAQDTQPQSINDSGWVTGYFRGRDGHVNGFVRTADGRIKTLNVPGSTLTQATSINGPGVITGNYQDASSLAHGFIRTPDGSITMIDVGSVLTQPMAINDSGMIVGYYIAKQAWTQRDGYVLRPRGFLRYPDGTTQKFDPPGSVGTYPTSINAGAVVAGYYFADHGVHGFSRSPDGVITVFDAPKADDQTFAMSINDTGDITGYYQKGVKCGWRVPATDRWQNRGVRCC